VYLVPPTNSDNAGNKEKHIAGTVGTIHHYTNEYFYDIH